MATLNESVLDGVDVDTLDRLMEYIYTGQCVVRDMRQALGMMQLKNMLMLDISSKLYDNETESDNDDNADREMLLVLAMSGGFPT